MTAPAHDVTPTVYELDRTRDQAWDAFVRRTPGGLPLHLSGWRDVLADTYGYRTHYLFAQDGEEIRGVLPLFIVPSRLTGRRMMTLPGGLCAADEAAGASLLDHAQEIASAENLNRIIIQDSRIKWTDQWVTESDHVYWLLPLPDAEETLWSDLDSNIRRQVRIARKNDLHAEVDRTGQLLEPFYDVFSRFTHQAGTPVFGLPFLRHVIDAFPNGFNITLVWHKETPVAGYFQLEMGQTMYGMWGAALPEWLKMRSAYCALWEIMRDAICHGFSVLDMGRSPAGSNASKFKGQWGGITNPIYQLTWRENDDRSAKTMTNQVQSDQRFQLFIQLWPKLPLSLSKQLGPRLRWHIPFA